MKKAEVQKPEKISSPPPLFPRFLRSRMVAESVVVEGLIGTDGAVSHPAVTQGRSIYFAAPALDAACGWHFKPATLDGRRVPIFYTLTIGFRS